MARPAIARFRRCGPRMEVVYSACAEQGWLGIRRESPKKRLRLVVGMSCPPQFWDGVLRRLGTEMPEFTLDAWVRPLAVEEHGEGLRLVCPTPFHRERIRGRFLPCIARCVEQEAGRPLTLELVVAPPQRAPQQRDVSRAGGASEATQRAQPRGAPAPPRRRSARARPSQAQLPYTFDSFVVGPCNALAREASFALAQDRQRGLNPLYLSSQPGLGKTHLARAVAHEARQRGSGRVIYESTESFTNRFTGSLRNKTMDHFKRRYREECDLLIVEDLQFLGSKASTQLEFFHTLTHLTDAGVRVVLSGDRLPRDIDGLDARLRSQITAGLVAEIEPPNAVVRRRILRAKAAAGGVGLPDDCLDLLVDAVCGSVRDLEGALIQLVTTASLLKRPIDLDLTRMALRKLVPGLPRARRLAPQAVIDVVATFFGTTREAMASRSRRRDVLRPRQLAMYLCRRYTDHPLSGIARAFNRDHPAVSNAVKVVERGILERAPLRYQVEELSARLDRL
jgi:chromosomal replication initiator protein